VQVAWLIEGDARRVTIYRPGMEPEVLEAPDVLRGDGVVAGFEVSTRRIWDVHADNPQRLAR
jgi:Uma2 family endonuclease